MEDTKIFSQGMSKIHGWMGQKKKAIQHPSKPKRREKIYAYVMPVNPRTAPLVRHQISLRVRLSRDSRNQRRYSRQHAAMRMRGGPARRWLRWSDGTEEVLYIGSHVLEFFSQKEDEVVYGFESGQVYSISEGYKIHMLWHVRSLPINLNALKWTFAFNGN